MKYLLDVGPQRTAEWRAARRGRLTASATKGLFKESRTLLLVPDAEIALGKGAKKAEVIEALTAARGKPVPADDFDTRAVNDLVRAGAIECFPACKLDQDAAIERIDRLIAALVATEGEECAARSTTWKCAGSMRCATCPSGSTTGPI